MIWQSQSGWIYDDDDEDDENDAFCMFHDADDLQILISLLLFWPKFPSQNTGPQTKPSNLYTTEVCSTFFWILASETSSFKASMVGEPRGSEPLTVGLPSGFGPVEMVEELQVFFFRWMRGWRVGWTHRNPISRVFCWFQPFGFPWRYCTPLKFHRFNMPKKRPPYCKGDTCSIIFQTNIYGI